MAFSKKYLEKSLKKYGFSVEMDATGMAYNAWCVTVRDPESPLRLSGPWGDRTAAFQCGVLELINLFANGKLAACDFETKVAEEV